MLFRSVKDGNFWGKRGEAQRQVEAALVPTLRAVVAWSGAAMQQPLTWDSYDGDVLGYYKHNRDTHYVVFLNRGKQAHEPKFNLTGLPPGDYSLRRINLDTDEQLLGHQSATNLAGGVEIGLIQPDRMVAIRLQRLP